MSVTLLQITNPKSPNLVNLILVIYIPENYKLAENITINNAIIKIDSITLSLTVCTKRYILSGQGNSTDSVFKQCQAMFGISSCGTNKDQLLQLFQSVRNFTNLQKRGLPVPLSNYASPPFLFFRIKEKLLSDRFAHLRVF